MHSKPTELDKIVAEGYAEIHGPKSWLASPVSQMKVSVRYFLRLKCARRKMSASQKKAKRKSERDAQMTLASHKM